MPYLIIKQPEGSVLRIVQKGTVTRQDLEGGRREAAEMAKASGTRRILVECRGAKVGFGQLDLHEFAVGLRDHFLPGTRVAVMMERNDPNRRDLEFLEDISYNRGFDLRLFTDDQKAWEWLAAGRTVTAAKNADVAGVAGVAAGLNPIAKV